MLTHTGGARADGYHMNIDTVTTVCPAGAGVAAACAVSHALGTWGRLQPRAQIGTYCLEPGSYEYEAHSNCAVAPVPVTIDRDEEKSAWRVMPTLSSLKDAWTVRRRQLQLAAGLLGAFSVKFSHLCSHLPVPQTGSPILYQTAIKMSVCTRCWTKGHGVHLVA